MKDNNFPSTNYMLLNKDKMSAGALQRLAEGRLPGRGVAYYGSYESAYKRLNLELAEGGM